MNGLSWLLYSAGVVDGVQTIATFAAVFGGIGAVLAGVCYGVVSLDGTFDDGDRARLVPFWGKLGRRLLIGAVLAVVIGLAVPSRSTLLLIAASELGEEIVTDPEVVDTAAAALDLIRTRIAQELADLTGGAPTP